MKKYITQLVTLWMWLVPLVAVGQDTGNTDPYQTSYNNTNISTINVTHKYAKWYDLRKEIKPSIKDGFLEDDDCKFYTNPYTNKPIQATHTVIDTIYTHKGSTIDLKLPDNFQGATSIGYYQRWCNFKTCGTFHIKKKNNSSYSYTDLLIPSGELSLFD